MILMTVRVTKDQRVRIEELKVEKGKKYIYESPDGGKTVYGREMKEVQREEFDVTFEDRQKAIVEEFCKISKSLKEIKLEMDEIQNQASKVVQKFNRTPRWPFNRS